MVAKRTKKCVLCNRSYKNDANLANHMITKHPADETQAEAEAQDGMTTPPATQTYAPASTPFLQNPTPAEGAVAKTVAETASVSTSATQVESPVSVVPDYKQLYIDALLDQIETLKKQVKSQEDQITYLQSSCAATTSTKTAASLSPSLNTTSAKPQQEKPIPPPQASAAGTATQRANPPTKQTVPKPVQQKRIDIIGDSMLGGVRNWNKPEYMVRVNSIGGATSQDAVEMTDIALRRSPDMIIIHTGTNDFDHKIKTKQEMQRIISKIRGKSMDIKIGISAICHREDRKNLQPKIKDMNNQLKTLCSQLQVTFIDHNDFDHSCLAFKGLHPNHNGSKSLFCDFDRNIKSII